MLSRCVADGRMWVIGTSNGPKYTQLQNTHNLEKQIGKIAQISFDRYCSGDFIPKTFGTCSTSDRNIRNRYTYVPVGFIK
jgi:hypothetical protein